MEFKGQLTRLHDTEVHDLGKTIPASDLDRLHIVDSEVFVTRLHALLSDYYPVTDQAPEHIRAMLVQLEDYEPELDYSNRGKSGPGFTQ